MSVCGQIIETRYTMITARSLKKKNAPIEGQNIGWKGKLE